MQSGTDLLAMLHTPYKDGRLLVAPSHRNGAFDQHGVDAPFVFSHLGRFWMTYIGFDGVGYQTAMASSDDLVEWHHEGIILGRGPVGSVAHYNAALTSILRDNELSGPSILRRVDGRFVGTWHAYPNAGYEAGPAVIGLCYSDDLRHWELGEPVLTADPGCAWEAGGLYKSWLLEDAGTYYLFYNAKNRTAGWPWIEQTGFATSRDLVHWTRHPGNPVLPIGPVGAFDDIFASDPCVLRHQGTWVMFYFGNSSDGHAREGVAFSEDLVHWKKAPEPLIDVGTPGSVDSLHAHKPALIFANGCLHHFYCAVAPGRADSDFQERGITCARSQPISFSPLS
jgi:hypothetical protein